MTLLVAVKSCLKDIDRGCHDVIRNTWGRHIPVKFFIGHSWEQLYRNDTDYLPEDYKHNGIRYLANDEYIMECNDGYDDLPYKTRCILEFFLEGYWSHIFLCDIDTFIVPERLVKTKYELFDYAGRFGSVFPIGTTFNHRDDRNNTIPNCHPWASGGVGYFLSRRAAEIVLAAPVVSWAEDLNVGQALGPHIQAGDIKAIDLPDFEGQVAWHFSRRLYENQMYDPKFEWMEKMYNENR